METLELRSAVTEIKKNALDRLTGRSEMKQSMTLKINRNYPV